MKLISEEEKEMMITNLLVMTMKTGYKYNTIEELFEAMDNDDKLKRDFVELYENSFGNMK
jgi:hypothetical protein